jgi:hypothetical protein
MSNPISLRRRTLIGALETGARGTKVVLTNSDFDVLVREPKVNREIAEYMRKLTTGQSGSLASVMGKRKANFSFSFDMNTSGTNSTAPKYAKFLKACGLKETVSAGVNVQWVPDNSADLATMTLCQQDMQMGSDVAVQVWARGCMGNAKITMDEVGNPLRAVCEFQGVLDCMLDDATPLTPGTFDAAVPDAVLTATATLGGVAMCFDTCELDFGNDVQMQVCPAQAEGLFAAYIADRNPQFSFNPQADLVANYDLLTKWKAGTLQALDLSTTHFSIAAPNAQIISAADGERAGAVTWEMVAKLVWDAALASKPFSITHT